MASCAQPDGELHVSESRGLHVADEGSRRAHGELVADLLFRPLGRLLVALLLPLRISPVAVVVANGAAGLAAAAAIFSGNLIAAALLLQLKTLLDNTDGQLARAAGRTSALGRYLDTEIDLVVNVALFAGLAQVTGRYALAVVAFLALTLVLSADFNGDVLYRRVRGEQVETEPSVRAEGRVASLLAAFYRVLYGPQDRALQGFASRWFEQIYSGARTGMPRPDALLVYHDARTVAVLANLGLSTQLAALGVCLLVGRPEAYLWLNLACAALLPLLQLRREARTRKALR